MNTENSKIRVMVLYGGKSGEHEVSLQTAASIIKHLDRTQYDIIPVAIDKQGDWQPQDLLSLDGAIQDHLPLPSPHLLESLSLAAQHSEQKMPVSSLSSSSSALKFSLSDHCRENIDVVFPALHGSFYEDGALQGLLELANIPYVGANVLASALGMDKAFSKMLAAQAHIPVIPYKILKGSQWTHDKSAQLKAILETFELPIFVKPANLGSSVATYKVTKATDLETALNQVFKYTEKALIEKAIVAREIEFAVLENEGENARPLVSGAGEIITSAHHDFYSYTAKYLDPTGATLVIPAALTPSQLAEGQAIAQQVFELLDVEGMARVDFLLDQVTGQLYFNEINTLPGFTAISMYPKLWDAAGLSYPELLSSLIRLALKRHERHRHISHDWSHESC